MTPLNFNMDELNMQVRQVIAHVVGTSPEKLNGVDMILHEWYKNKKHFISKKLFNGNLIKEICHVEIKLSEERKTELAQKFIYSLCDDWAELFPDWSDYADEAWELSRFLRANMPGFFENKTVEEYEAPDTTIIGKDVKISKNFKHFFDNDKLLRLIQDKYSEVVQQDKITGTFCASIHPLDFLSSSENNYGWRSCHALNGDYAGGNLSYMMDNCTIIFYIKGADDVKLPRFPETVPWNDKKWRMLAFISDFENIIWYGRQYPFFSEEMLKQVFNFFEVFYSTHYYYPDSEYITNMRDYRNELTVQIPPHIYYGDKILPKDELIRNAPAAAHYNDLLNSHCYTPYYSIRATRHYTHGKYPLVTVGHSPICACCGKQERILTNELVSKDCNKKLHPSYCDCCGELMPDGPYDWIYGLGKICINCFDKYVEKCPTCGHWYAKQKPCMYCGIPIGEFSIDPDIILSDEQQF